MNAFGNPTTYLILMVLHAAAWLYAYRGVRAIRSKNPRHGHTALFVVMGDGAVALAAVLVVAANGPVDWLTLAAILVAALAAGGLPMIWEYVESHTALSQAENLRRDAVELQRLLQEEE